MITSMMVCSHQMYHVLAASRYIGKTCSARILSSVDKQPEGMTQ